MISAFSGSMYSSEFNKYMSSQIDRVIVGQYEIMRAAEDEAGDEVGVEGTEEVQTAGQSTEGGNICTRWIKQRLSIS